MKKLIIILTLIFVTPISAMHRVAQITGHMAPQQTQHLQIAPASTLDHLSYDENRETVRKALGKCIAEHKELIRSIMIEEQKHKKTGNYRVMYHNCDCRFRVLHDLFAFAYEHTTGKQLSPNTILLRHWTKGSPYNNVQKYLDSSYSTKQYWSDHQKEVFDILLAVNFSLTGNSNLFGESTLDYFFHNQSVALFNRNLTLEQTFRELCDLYNINHSYIPQLVELVQMVTTTEGNILQIAMPHTLVNKYVYIAKPLGIPSPRILKKDNSIIGHIDFNAEKNRYTAAHNVLKELFDDKTQRDNINPHSVDAVQGRILLTNEGMLNPEGSIRIKRYTTLSPEREAAYKEKAHALFTEMFKGVPCKK